MATKYCVNGRNKVVDIIDGTAAAPANIGTGNNFVGWGTGAGTTTDADTTLFTEATEARVGGTVSQPTADKNQWVATIAANGTKTITNAGLFDASTAGNLVVKGDFAGIPVVLNDQIQFTVTLQQTSA